MEKDHIRAPILQTIRKSPFDGLERHFKLVRSGIAAFEKAINHYIDGDYPNFKKFSEKVNKYEQQADKIKGNVRNHLPKFVFIPIDKRDFLSLLGESDGILDSAEDITVLMDMRKTVIPNNIKDDLRAILKKDIEIIDTLSKALEMFKFMMESSFGGKTREDIKKVIHHIHKLEHDSDVLEKKISKHLFNVDNEDHMTLIHLLKIMDRIGSIADHAENAADRIRAMLAK